MKQFNLSPSSLSIWAKSELVFYYSALSDIEPDTKVNQVYGLAGNVVHECLEDYAKTNDRMAIMRLFSERWKTAGLDVLKGMRGKPLSKTDYQLALLHGIELIDEQYEIVDTELFIELPLHDTINKKGYIDVVCLHEGRKMILDWKTSSSMDMRGDFRNQVLFYAHLYYCRTGEIVNHARIEYLKIQKHKDFEFADDEIINFADNVLMPIVRLIGSKGDDERNYALGDYVHPFNPYLQRCRKRAEEIALI